MVLNVKSKITCNNNLCCSYVLEVNVVCTSVSQKNLTTHRWLYDSAITWIGKNSWQNLPFYPQDHGKLFYTFTQSKENDTINYLKILTLSGFLEISSQSSCQSLEERKIPKTNLTLQLHHNNHTDITELLDSVG